MTEKMYIVMYRDRYNDEEDIINCIFDNKQLAIEQYFPLGIDEMGRSLDSIEGCDNDFNQYQGFYLVEIDKNRSSLINSLLNEVIINYLFDNRW